LSLIATQQWSICSRRVKAFTDRWPDDKDFIDTSRERIGLSEQWVANLYLSLADFHAAHVAFLRLLFVQPTVPLNGNRWGLKEIALKVKYRRHEDQLTTLRATAVRSGPARP
jgi:hypothetical protein